jgi:tetratricopeptide (TPR) repeat protein
MAPKTKKDQLIEDAQKFAQRYQYDKAAKVYEQILALDPAAINQRQKLAELLIKCGKSDEARKELETIGKHFSKSGFYLKAVAVYKQMQKLFPEDISLCLTLAELYGKHGLIANSLSEYKTIYEFHESAGNFPEALAILDRMQNVDPQNIPIKIKFAEACLKQKKKEDSYAVFSKTASLLLERRDSATLLKVCSRVQQLFSDKPDFIHEVLTEQISQGNAASTIDHLQGLLRSDPKNKRVWDLVVLAYQSLEQPQRVKIAYQHYLNFFPTEPAAILGLISSFTAERDFSGALELLDKHEDLLIFSGFLLQLKGIYQSLDEIVPINIRVLEGLRRVAVAAGNESEVLSITSKLQSLNYISGGVQESSPPLSETISEQKTVQDITPPVAAVPVPSEVTAETGQLPEEEIDIDIDFDSPFDSFDQENITDSTSVNVPGSIGDLFDTITTAPRGVKFGNDGDNSDAQSHFDLGLAFKEMGLYDEAINEFRQASQDASRRVECLIMQCACLRERGELEKSITMLLVLLKSGLSGQESCAVKYELSTGYETAGKTEDANLLLNEIYATDPDFRDIRSRLNSANISDPSDPSDPLDFSDDDFKDF